MSSSFLLRYIQVIEFSSLAQQQLTRAALPVRGWAQGWRGGTGGVRGWSLVKKDGALAETFFHPYDVKILNQNISCHSFFVAILKHV